MSWPVGGGGGGVRDGSQLATRSSYQRQGRPDSAPWSRTRPRTCVRASEMTNERRCASCVLSLAVVGLIEDHFNATATSDCRGGELGAKVDTHGRNSHVRRLKRSGKLERRHVSDENGSEQRERERQRRTLVAQSNSRGRQPSRRVKRENTREFSALAPRLRPGAHVCGIIHNNNSLRDYRHLEKVKPHTAETISQIRICTPVSATHVQVSIWVGDVQ